MSIRRGSGMQGCATLSKERADAPAIIKSKKEPTEDVFFSRLFCIEKSDVRLGEDTLVRSLKSSSFTEHPMFILRVTE